MRPDTPVGRRVITNDNYPMRRLHPDGRVGTIIGESHDRTCWRIVFDGVRTPSTIHKKFLDFK